MVISKEIWDHYQALRSSRYDDGMTIAKEIERRGKVLKLHLALFYNIGEKPDKLLEGDLVNVPRPWVRYRRDMDIE